MASRVLIAVREVAVLNFNSPIFLPLNQYRTFYTAYFYVIGLSKEVSVMGPMLRETKLVQMKSNNLLKM